MRITPKKTKYHYTFRNKLQTKKIATADIRAQFPFGKRWAHYNQIFKINAWHHSLILCSGATEPTGLKSTVTYRSSDDLNKSYLSHVITERLLFGNYAIIFETHGTLTAKFIKTIHLDIAKTLKKKSKVWLRLCCDTPVTARPVETRMGKGKGAISYWEAKVCPGQVFFEFSGITETGALSLLKKIQEKSPQRLRLIGTRVKMPLV